LAVEHEMLCRPTPEAAAPLTGWNNDELKAELSRRGEKLTDIVIQFERVKDGKPLSGVAVPENKQARYFKNAASSVGWFLKGMRHPLRTPLLIIIVALAVGLLGLHSTLHWHGPNYDNCQACHSGRTAVFQPVVQLALQAPAPVARFAPPETTHADIEPVYTPRTPRAPPA